MRTTTRPVVFWKPSGNEQPTAHDAVLLQGMRGAGIRERSDGQCRKIKHFSRKTVTVPPSRHSNGVPIPTSSGLPQRLAFTLLELLIAVGLTSILMVALFSAMNIYFNLQLDSHEEITRQQVARALLRQMTRDIQSVVFVRRSATDEEDDTGTTSSGSSSSSSTGTSGSSNGASGMPGNASGSSTSAGFSAGSGTAATSSGSGSSATSQLDGNSYGGSTIDPETVLTTYTNGLVGSATDLQLFVSRPDRTLSYVSAQNLTSTADRSGDLMIIRYLMADSSGGGLAEKIAEREAPEGDSGPVGLAKMEGDLFGLSTAVQTDEEYPQLSASQLVAREVAKIGFRYFDGLNWQEQWDSTALNELPKSIEITLTLRDLQSAGTAFSDQEADPWSLPETIHRMVVPIPIAEPFVTESAL